ncbi:hypothetical protein DPMN_027323 [Dreissena polymorpha]|uniref:Uncharacterized protein n=1 Tax=Dreissena polymorpha TaxID=45954 RepID=A0A9D4LSN4_DREPO|nr:hypothetical protein DPMN_027323 [Dreissena polymorpha]
MNLDCVVFIVTQTKTSSFVLTVKHLNGFNHPVITLFNSQQIRDIKRFCCVNNGQVLGMDKTFNLGEFQVTPTVYKDISVVNRSKGPPSALDQRLYIQIPLRKRIATSYTM